ncbi:MAG: LamG domain-containing protein, partial [Candidatus Marinimicrobia bacterium]|nr:LamG domain-containing protein [Candidatus Neomarinimicrobiota bacterium]
QSRSLREATLQPVQPTDNEPLQKYIVPLNGRFIPGENPSTIGTNFRSLINMEPCENHPQSVKGMTKVATTSLLLQDFTGYTETDPGSTITVASTAITLASVDLATDSSVSTTIGDLPDCFVHEFSFHIDTLETVTISPFIWRIQDSGGNYVALEVVAGAGTALDLWLSSPADFTSDAQLSGTYAEDTTYYIRILRDYSEGTNVFYAYAYSDSNFSTLVGSATATANTKRTYVTLYAFKTPNTGVACSITGTINNLVCSRSFPYNAYYWQKPIELPYSTTSGVYTPETHLIAEKPAALSTDASSTYFASLYQDATNFPPTAATLSSVSSRTADIGRKQFRFAQSSNGMLIICREGMATSQNFIYGGDEFPCGAFITGTAITATSITNPRDWTDIASNADESADNVVVIGGGNDSYTKLLLHGDGADGDTTITDSAVGGSAPPKTVTASGSAQIDTSQTKFGTGSILFSSATSDFVYVDSTDADIDDFYMGTGAFTIDFWVRFSSVAAENPFFSQYVDGDNYVEATHTGTHINLTIKSATVTTVALSCDHTAVANVWYHIAFVRGYAYVANNWAVLVNGTVLASGLSDADPWPDLNADFDIGRRQAGGAVYMNGWLDEFRVSKGIARWIKEFTSPVRPYSNAGKKWLIGSTLPLESVTCYVKTACQLPNTFSVSHWNGSSLSALTVSSDGTRDVGNTTSLYQTGTVSFGSTVDTAKPRYWEGRVLYYYLFELSDGECEISFCTCTAPFQKLLDAYDGIERKIAACFQYTTSYTDLTASVREDEYDSADDSTHAVISSMGAFDSGTGANCLIIGFLEQITALNIGMVPGETNSTANTTAAVDYWEGSGWQESSGIVDGTFEDTYALGKSGTISWSIPESHNWFKRTIANNSTPLYYLRLRFDEAMDASVAIYYISGIPAPKNILGYDFPLFAFDSVFLCGENAGRKNVVRYSMEGTAQVFNGDSSDEILIGDEKRLTCGAPIYMQVGNAIYNNILM